MILLDTNAVLWIFLDSENLGPEAREQVLEAETILISSVTGWELGQLIARRRITLNIPLESWLANIEDQPGIRFIPLSMEEALQSTDLPGTFHPDPADRFFVATARCYDCPIMTSDGLILRYAAAGHVKAINARR